MEQKELRAAERGTIGQDWLFYGHARSTKTCCAAAIRVVQRRPPDDRARDMQGLVNVAYRAFKSPRDDTDSANDITHVGQIRMYTRRYLDHGVLQMQGKGRPSGHHRVIALHGRWMISIITGQNDFKSPSKLDRYQ